MIFYKKNSEIILVRWVVSSPGICVLGNILRNLVLIIMPFVTFETLVSKLSVSRLISMKLLLYYFFYTSIAVQFISICQLGNWYKGSSQYFVSHIKRIETNQLPS